MSTLKVNTIQNTAGVEVYTAKAWVNFNGTGTVAIRASGNVSSITDNGVGDYTVNFISGMSDANYSSAGHTSATLSAMNCVLDTSKTTTTFRVFCVGISGTAVQATDPASVNIAVFR